MVGDSRTQLVAAQLTRETLLALSKQLREPEWLQKRRLEAFDLYQQLPMPGPHLEEWRRTDLSGLALDSLTPYGQGMILEDELRRLIAFLKSLTGAPEGDRKEEWAGLLVQGSSGVLLQDQSEALKAQGVLFMDLRSAIREVPDLLQEYLMVRCIRPDEDKFRALHAAFLAGGTFLYVPRGVEIALPLISSVWIEGEGVAIFPHTLVVAESQSKVTLIEDHRSSGGEAQAFSAGAVELILGDGAHVRYISLGNWALNTWEVSTIRGILGRDATLHTLVASFGGNVVKVNVESILQGQGATSEMLGVFFGTGRQHFDFHTLQEHQSPHTTSDLLYKGALADRAYSVFAGLIRAHYGAQKTNAFQSNRNLILSDGARADSMPKLEIMANDLRCTHGASVSRIDEEYIFYLMSRGLTRIQAVHMIVDGFFSEVLDRLPLEGLREGLREEITKKMQGRGT
ncbi:MAG: Fe-S cluster assembly protein SufD [Armatimonadota bacterium]|nr:Fe-S cluster assembly protein SufD [Armatimonadota bacterium]